MGELNIWTGCDYFGQIWTRIAPTFQLWLLLVAGYKAPAPPSLLSPSQISFVIRGNKIKARSYNLLRSRDNKLKRAPARLEYEPHEPEYESRGPGFRNDSSPLIGPGPDKVKTMEMWVSGANQLSVMGPGPRTNQRQDDIRCQGEIRCHPDMETLMCQVGIQPITGALNQTRRPENWALNISRSQVFLVFGNNLWRLKYFARDWLYFHYVPPSVLT